MMGAYIALLAGMLATAGCGDRGEPATTTQPAPSSAPSHDLLVHLSILATGRPPPDKLLDIAHQRSLDAYIDALLATRGFAELAPQILFGDLFATNNTALSGMGRLRTVESDGDPIYTLRDPCPRGSTVAVRPWWQPDAEVSICPDSYRPDRLADEATGWRCGGIAATNRMLEGNRGSCGCGPHLAFCFRDELHRSQVRDELEREVNDTIAYIVGNDLPLERIAAGNETLRSGTPDFFYQRDRLLRGELREPPSASTPRAWRRRELPPGDQAGILTTYGVLYNTDGPRDRIRDITSGLWCVEPSSTNVRTESVLSLGEKNLREGAGWKELAARPFCTDCHARLDYGMQFFLDYPSAVAGAYRIPVDKPATGKLYANDISDERGEGALTPRGFGELAVAQPEFARCVVRNLADHVFGPEVSPETQLALTAAFEETHRLKPMMKLALLRYAEHWSTQSSRPRVTSAVAAAPASTADGLLPVDGRLRALLDQHCVECHDERDVEPVTDFQPGALPTELIQEMLHQVAWGTMPKRATGLAPTDRSELIDVLVRRLWGREPEQVAAAWYFRDHAALPVHRSVGKPSIGSPRANLLQLTPDFVLTIAHNALRVCRRGDELDAKCVAGLTEPTGYVNRRVRP